MRERIALIEKGLVPPPEVDPRGFDQQMSRVDPTYAYERYRSYRHRRSGLIIMAVGLGSMVFFFPNFRAGGFLVVLGLAFFLSSFLGLSPPPPRQP